MSCNGCRVLRKGCSETCILRPCLQWIENAEAQGHATVFVAKFFGRAGLMSFITAVPENQRQALFQSLLYEAAGRTVNPVNGAVGLMWTGNWQVCQAAVETILRGGALTPITEFLGEVQDDASECTEMFKVRDFGPSSRPNVQKRRRLPADPANNRIMQLADLDVSLTPRIKTSPSRNSEESMTTTCEEDQRGSEIKLLNLFN